jgi:hypothetical protein
MAETSIRWAVAKHIVATVRGSSAATGVLVEPGWPGDQHTKPDMVWIDDISDTDATVPVMTGSRSHRDDMFTIRVIGRVTGRRDLDATMTRLEELGALLENPVADEPTLDDFDGIVSADFAITAMTCGRTPQGCVGYAAYDLRIHARLT